jgi:hypothetical protein
MVGGLQRLLSCKPACAELGPVLAPQLDFAWFLLGLCQLVLLTMHALQHITWCCCSWPCSYPPRRAQRPTDSGTLDTWNWCYLRLWNLLIHHCLDATISHLLVLQTQSLVSYHAPTILVQLSTIVKCPASPTMVLLSLHCFRVNSDKIQNSATWLPLLNAWLKVASHFLNRTGIDYSVTWPTCSVSWLQSSMDLKLASQIGLATFGLVYGCCCTYQGMWLDTLVSTGTPRIFFFPLGLGLSERVMRVLSPLQSQLLHANSPSNGVGDIFCCLH